MLPLCVALFAAAEPAVAAKTTSLPYVAVFAKGSDSSAEANAGRLEYDLSAALTKHGAQLADFAQRFSPPIESSEEGDKLIAAGKDAYDNLDLDGAVSKLNAGAVFFIKNPTTTTPKKMAEIFLFLGAAGLQNGNKQAGKDLARALLLDPDLKPDPKYFAADVEKAIAAAKAEIASRKKLPVLIESVPSGSAVELDGKALGVTPLPAVELPTGRHYVRITHPGYRPAAKFPEVEAGVDANTKLELTALPTYAEQLDAARKLIGHAGFDTQKLPPQATQIAGALQARYLVLMTTKTVRGISTEAEAQVWDVQTGDRLRELKLVVDPASLDKTADAIKRWMDRPAPEMVVEAQPSSSSGVLNKPWFYVVVGVVVAGAAAGTAYGLTRASHRYNPALDLP